MTTDFLAGYASGCASIIIGNPLDLLKVRLQSQSAPSIIAHDAESIATVHAPLTHAGTSRAASTASARTLLAGLPAPLITYGFLNAILFSTYTRSLALWQSALHGQGDAAAAPTLPAHFVAGCLAGLATLPLSNPTELVKCRVQALTPTGSPASAGATAGAGLHDPGPTSYTTARSIYNHAGLRGFMHGAGITAVRDSLGYGFYFAGYEWGKGVYDWWCASGGSTGGEDDAVKILLCGGVAGVLTWSSIYPLDAVKTRVQTQGSGARLGAWGVAREMYGERGGGLRVFTRGMGLCCARAFVVNAVQWFVFEWCVRVLG